MPDISLIGYIVVSPADLPKITAELPNHIRLTLEEPGCIEFRVTRDEDDPTVFHVSERFDSAESFERHQSRVRDSKWGSITTNVERNYTITGLDSQ